MIIKGGATSGAWRVAAHLLRTDQNERAEVKELRGVMGGNLRDALCGMETAGLCSRTTRPLYHASINPRASEFMTEAQWMQAVDKLESALGLTGQPRAIIEHVKDGRAHRHVVWSRIDLARGRAIRMDHNFRTHEVVARQLEREFGFERVQGAHVEREGRRRPDRTPSHDEMQQAARSGIHPKEAKAVVTALWRATTTGRAFADALTKTGWTLARGDRRDFVLIDGAGGVHSLARRIEGATAQDVRARMADIDPAQLPTVKEARAKLPRSPMLPFPHSITRQARQRMAARDQAKRGTVARSATTVRAQEPRAPSAGLYVTVSRKRLDYGRPLIQAGANTNTPPVWTTAQIVSRGEFRGLARMMALPVASPRLETFAKPVRPMIVRQQNTGVADNVGAGADDGLRAFLSAIADEVNGRTVTVCAALSAEFAGRIKATIANLPRDQAAAAIATLKQMKHAAIKAVQEAATIEIKERQKQVAVTWRRRHVCTLTERQQPPHNNLDNIPK